MHFLLICHAVVGFALALIAREPIGLLVAPDVFSRRVFPYANKQFDLEQAQRRAVRALQYAFAWHCLLTGFCHVYHAEHLHLVAMRDAARQAPPPYGCEGNWDWNKLTLAEKLRDTVLTDIKRRCATYMEETSIEVWPNLIVVVVDTVLLAPLRAVDAVADSFGSALSGFLSHFGWILQLFMLALVPVAALAACYLWPLLPSRAGERVDVEPIRLQGGSKLLIEEVEFDDRCMVRKVD